MITKTLVVNTIDTLKKLVNTGEIDSLATNASSVFIQIFTSLTDPFWADKIEAILRKKFIEAIIVGVSTGGEIAHGELFVNSTIVSITFFEKTNVKAFIIDATAGNESELGKQLYSSIENVCTKIAGVLLLATPLTMNISNFLTGFENSNGTYPVFGGGAGDYASMWQSLIFSNGKYLSKGVVAVVFMGDQIKIETHTYLGWQPLSKEMIITEMDGLWVKKLMATLPSMSIRDILISKMIKTSF